MSITVYEIPESRIVHETSVDFSYRNIVGKVIHLVQYDKKIPIIAVKLYNAGNTYIIPEDTENMTVSMKIRWGKKDQTFVYKDVLGCNQHRNTVYFEVDNQMSVFDGQYDPILELVLEENDIRSTAGSSPIPILMDKNPVQEYYSESSTVVTDLEKIYNDTVEEANRAEVSAEEASEAALEAKGYRDELSEAIESIPTTASELPYVNASSGLIAEDTQAAIDEVNNKVFSSLEDNDIPYFSSSENKLKSALVYEENTSKKMINIKTLSSSKPIGIGFYHTLFDSYTLMSEIYHDTSGFNIFNRGAGLNVISQNKNINFLIGGSNPAYTRMCITSQGRVGIGTSMPSERLHIEGNQILTGNLSVGGNLTVSGTTFIIETETIKLKDNIIEINSGQTGTPPPTLKSGIEVNRGDYDNFLFVFDESDDRFKIGVADGLQTVATRLPDNSMENTVIPMFDSTTHSFINTAMKYNDTQRTVDIAGGMSIMKYSGYNTSPFLLCYNMDVVKASISATGKGYFDNIETTGDIISSGKLYASGLANKSGVSYSNILTGFDGVVINRNVQDATPALTVNNIQGTNKILDIQQNGDTIFSVNKDNIEYSKEFIGNLPTGNTNPLMTLRNEGAVKFQVMYNGNISTNFMYSSGVVCISGFEYGNMTVQSSGFAISRNINDANPTLIVNKLQGTSNILEVKTGTQIRFAVDVGGNIRVNNTTFSNQDINNLKYSIQHNKSSVAIYNNVTDGVIDTNYSLRIEHYAPGSEGPSEVIYSGRITLNNYNSVASFTLPTSDYLLRPNLQTTIVKSTPYDTSYNDERDIAFGSVEHDDINLITKVYIGHAIVNPSASSKSKTIDFCVRGLKWV